MDVRSTIGAELAFARKYDTAIANPARVACDLHRHFSNALGQARRGTDSGLTERRSSASPAPSCSASVSNLSLFRLTESVHGLQEILNLLCGLLDIHLYRLNREHVLALKMMTVQELANGSVPPAAINPMRLQARTADSSHLIARDLNSEVESVVAAFG